MRVRNLMVMLIIKGRCLSFLLCMEYEQMTQEYIDSVHASVILSLNAFFSQERERESLFEETEEDNSSNWVSKVEKGKEKNGKRSHGFLFYFI